MTSSKSCIFPLVALVLLLASVATADVTLSQYYSIKSGMTYNQVVSILGSPDEELSRVELSGYSTVMYMWEGNSNGGNMNAMFQNGKLISKAQFGLK